MNVQQSMMTEALRRWRIIPVIVIDEPKNAVPLATALLAGGLPIAEITLRTPDALDALRRITQEQPEMFAGVGTVLNVRQAEQARKAGAHFVISPGLNRAVVDYCLEHDVPVYPGVATASEIEAAIETSATSSDPANCTKLQTQAFVEQSTSTEGAEAVKMCEAEAKEGENAESVAVSNVEVESSAASAEAAITGSSLDGQTVEVALVKEGGQWKLDEIAGFSKLDKTKLAAFTMVASELMNLDENLNK